MQQHRKLRRVGVGSTLAIIALLVSVVAGPLRVAPATAATPTFTDVKVTTQPTSVTINFTAKHLYGVVFVTVGTGLDPETTQVARVTLPKQSPYFPWYSATLNGLKPGTAYSFRLSTPGLPAYTDITSIVTPALPLKFTNVNAHASYVDGVIGFDYAGAGPVTVYIGTNLNFETQYLRKYTLTAPTYGHHWIKVAPLLAANTGYAFKLTAPNTPAYVDITSIVTRKRNVVLSYKSLKVVNDGDAWPYGCGDFAFTHIDVNSVANPDYHQTFLTNQCMNDGDTLDLTKYNLTSKEYDDVRSNSFRTWFYAWDDDRKVLDGDCAITFVDTVCGDLGWGEVYIDISKPGTVQWAVHSTGWRYGNNVDVWAYGDAVVTFS